jgi:uncharacterized protein (TIGR02996 family)
VAKRGPLAQALLPGERDLLSAVVGEPADDAPRLVYADWLEDRGDARGSFLRAFVAAARSMDPAAFPKARGFPEEWLELIGYRLLERLAAGGAPELKRRLLKVARPALRMREGGWTVPVGASRVGGLPDLPPGFPWPLGKDCRAIYNDETEGVDRLAGFLAQVNCAEVAGTQAGRDLPDRGLLSFFCFQDIEHDNPDVIGAGAFYFPDPAGLVRTDPPGELTEGNTVIPYRRLTFAETLDLPEASDGPWSKDIRVPYSDRRRDILDYFRKLNFRNLLGYARATSGGAPTPSKRVRHLILLDNAVGCRLHIQITKTDLAAHRFDRIKLAWVDFD